MKKIQLLLIILTALLLSSCSGNYITKDFSEQDLIESLGYEKIYSTNNSISCTEGEEGIQNAEVLGIKCNHESDSRLISVVGTNEKPTHILVIPTSKKNDIITFDYNFPSKKIVIEQVQNFIKNLDEDNPLTYKETLYYNLMPYAHTHHVDFFNSHDIEFPLFITAASTQERTGTYSFIVTMHSDNVARLHLIDASDNTYELIYEFE